MIAILLLLQLADPIGTPTPPPEMPPIAFPAAPAPTPRPEELLLIAPECAHARGARANACKAARTILLLDPPHATAFYLAHWSAVSFGQDAALSHGGVGLYPVDPPRAIPMTDPADPRNFFGPCFPIAAGVDAMQRQHLTRIQEHGRITTRALDRVYRRDGGPYSQRMLGQLPRVNYGVQSTFDLLLATHADALGTTVEDLTAPTPDLPPVAVPRVSDALYRPTGKGPDVFPVRGGGAVVVETGDRLSVTRRDGIVVRGTVVAVSPRGIAMRDKRGEIVVLAADVDRIRHE